MAPTASTITSEAMARGHRVELSLAPGARDAPSHPNAGASGKNGSSSECPVVLDAEAVEAFDRYTRLAASVAGTPMAALVLVDAGRIWFQSTVGAGTSERPHGEAAGAPLCASLWAHAIAGDRPLLVRDARTDGRFADSLAVHRPPGIGLYAGAPLCTPPGHRIGALCAFDHVPRVLDPEPLARLIDLANAVVTTFELYQTVHEIKLLALTDTLTGLPNRMRLYQTLGAAVSASLRHSAPLSLLYIDCDNFKHVNDTMGHVAGDQMLQAIAAVLAGCLRTEEMPARVGGDEFVLPGSGSRTARLTADRIQHCCSEAMAAGSWPTSLSIGAVTFLLPPSSVDEAIVLADQAMYAAKRGGGNQVCSVVTGDRGPLSVMELAAMGDPGTKEATL
jgi:diguanylate cyclase (GGDEF)-like protein